MEFFIATFMESLHLHTHNAITPTISKLPSVPQKINF
jgi:hypothetical protein